MNNLIFLLLLSLVLLPLHVFAAALVEPVGSWFPIRDVKDPHIVALGKFAVSEYNRQSKSGLTFVTVLTGESQVVLSGVNYRLLVTASDGKNNNYVATVWEKPWMKSMNLISFKPFATINSRFL